jgi:hypothetical protein
MRVTTDGDLGHVPHTIADVLERASFGMDRADAAERRREREAAEELGKPEPRKRPPVWEIAAKQRELADHEQSPATLAQVHELQGRLSSLLAKIYAATGRKLI